MEGWEYQALMAAASQAAAGQDVSAQIAAIPAAAGTQQADWAKVEQIVTDYSRSNQERLLAYYNEVLPQQSADLIEEVTAAAPTAEAFVSQSLPAQSGVESASLIGTGFGVDPTAQAINPDDIPVMQAGLGIGSIAGIIGMISGLWSGYNELKDIWDMGSALGISGSGSTFEGASSMANGTDMVVVNNGTSVGGVSFGGPGVPEPPASMVAKAWKTKAFSKTSGEYWVYFWKLIDGRILSYNAAKKSAKIWRPKKPIVLYRGSVTLSQAVKTQRMLDKLWKTVAKKTKQLKLA